MNQRRFALSTTSSEWRCKHCSLLLGITDERAVFVKFKGAEFTVRGELSRRCPRCSEENRIETRSVA